MKISRKNSWGVKDFRTFSPRQIKITTDNKITPRDDDAVNNEELIKQDALERENEYGCSLVLQWDLRRKFIRAQNN